MRKVHGNVAALAATLMVSCLPLAAAEWSKSISTKGASEVVVDVDDGSITLTAGDANTVGVRVTTKGREIRSGDVSPEASRNGDVVNIRVAVARRSFEWSAGERWVRTEVRVPPGVKLRAHSGDGSIHADGVKGMLRLSSGDGSIQGNALDGTLEAETRDGSVSVEGRFDGLHLRTGDGSIRAGISSGSKMTSGWDVSTGDGSVTLRVPVRFACDLDVHTGDGGVHLSVPITGRSGRGKQDVFAKVNGGGPLLRVRTGDGSVNISER